MDIHSIFLYITVWRWTKQIKDGVSRIQDGRHTGQYAKYALADFVAMSANILRL